MDKDERKINLWRIKCSDKGSDAGESTEEDAGAEITTAKIFAAAVREKGEAGKHSTFFLILLGVKGRTVK